MTETDPYVQRWKEVRRGYYLFFGTWLAFPLVGILVDKLDQRLASGSQLLPAVFLPIYGLFWIYTSVRMRRWRCPRCEGTFISRGWWRNDFAVRCGDCGLTRGATFAQAQAGTFEEVRFSWRRVLRMVLASLEILTGVIVVVIGISWNRSTGLRLLLSAAGFVGFFVPGLLLASNSRWRWWSQISLVPALILILASIA